VSDVPSPLRDLAVVGCGPVGGTFVLALAGHGLDVVGLDARAPGTAPKGDRSLALSHGARLTFERVGVWDSLARREGAVTPILEIDISQAGGFGTMRLTAREQRVPALGYVVSYVALQHEIDEALARAGATVRFGSAVDAVDADPAAATVRLVDATDAPRARLAVVADGTGAAIRGIERARHDYGQVALVGAVWIDRPHGGIAYERFTPEGPMALLPERDHYGLVWTMRPEQSRGLLELSETAFLAALADRFGTRVEGFTRVANLRTFPLVLERARPVVAARAVVIGNAAQQLHPVAGQGFNLGVRDAWELARIVLETPRDALGSPAMLARYAASRAPDRTSGIAFTHGLTRIFGNDLAAMRWPRGLALAALDAMPPVKRAFARAMLYGVR
jgi:2-octaprenyl-6-methoxyphenol hydroxylase